MPSASQPQALTRKLIYRSRWVNLYVDTVQFPNGFIVDQHHLLDFDYAAVLILTQDAAGRYPMVKVCRYPTGRAEWEFPAGGMEADESIVQAAERELRQETGCCSSGHTLLYSYNPMNGIANKVFHIVRCQLGEYVGNIDTNEVSAVAWFSAAQIREMIHRREMHCGYTLTAFLLDQHL